MPPLLGVFCFCEVPTIFVLHPFHLCTKICHLLCHFMSYYVILCHVMLCFATLCYAMLCFHQKYSRYFRWSSLWKKLALVNLSTLAPLSSYPSLCSIPAEWITPIPVLPSHYNTLTFLKSTSRILFLTFSVILLKSTMATVAILRPPIFSTFSSFAYLTVFYYFPSCQQSFVFYWSSPLN